MFGSTALYVLFASPLEAGLAGTTESGHADPRRHCGAVVGPDPPEKSASDSRRVMWRWYWTRWRSEQT